jgi:hypothetical protein
MSENTFRIAVVALFAVVAIEGLILIGTLAGSVAG